MRTVTTSPAAGRRPSTRVTLDLDAGDYDALKALTQQLGCTKARLLRELIRACVTQQQLQAFLMKKL